jgi:predicted DsbA family dithiol-disulfide isomerase/tRNA-binding EMAP/Myf-like protein
MYPGNDVFISSRILKKVAPEISSEPDAAAERLRGVGLKVEEIIPLADLLRPVVIGRVSEVSPHPNADRLHICQVDVGDGEPLQIVTGAENVREGGLYAVIRSGTTLPNGTRIRKGKLRGERSEGMLGSADELELGDDHQGLLEIDGSPAPGTALPDALQVTGFVLRVGGAADLEELTKLLLARGAAELQIDIFADIACPWCYIGEQRLAAVLAGRTDLSLTWRWRPYQLQPAIPPTGLPWAEFVASKFAADAAAVFQHTQAVGEEAGLDFRFDRITSAPNTVNAHRLILHAEQSGRARQTADALFHAYFTEGRDVGDTRVLIRVADEAGLDADEVEAYLASDAGRDAVEESQDAAARLGISGVPFYIFNGRVGISGAQDHETFARAVGLALREDG